MVEIYKQTFFVCVLLYQSYQYLMYLPPHPWAKSACLSAVHQQWTSRHKEADFFFRIYISVYKLRKMSNGIWCPNTLKNLAVNDLPRITEWTCDEDLSWSFRLGLFEKVQFQKHKLIFANFCNEFISINFWRTIDSLLFCFAWVLTLLKEKMKQLPVITNYLSVS